MRIVMAGSSGFLGTNLRHRLVAEGHEVIRLVRRDPSNLEERRWRPELGELHPANLAGADAVINLAGAHVAAQRWTEAYKAELRTSRVDPTRTLVTAMTSLPAADRPRVLLNGSGVHFYGPTGDNAVDEETPPGTGFMPEMCVAWESATTPAADAGIRVVRMRTGLVLDRDAGLLKLMGLVTKLFIGGKIGNGRQWMPWITLRDWVSAAAFVLEQDDLAGPVNITGPNPSRNADFTAALGRALHRPTIFPTPRFGVRLVMGEFGNEAIDSLRVLPAVLSRAGFPYRDADLDQALRVALHKA